MSRRMGWGAAVAVLAAVAGGVAGGAVAIAAPAVLAPQAPVVADAAPQILPVVDRTLAAADPAVAPSATAVPDGAAAAVETPAPSGAEAAAADLVASAASPAASCPANVTGATPGAPATVSAAGVAGTTSADLDAFAAAYNAQRVANCLAPVPPANFRYDACMEARLFWMAEDPSSDSGSAWGHIGSQRSDGLPSVGCDGNLAGGMNNVGTTFARKWWDSSGHRISVYAPAYTGSLASVCIYFAVTHGGVPDEPAAFARAAARWGSC